jgi:hypothetical protein
VADSISGGILPMGLGYYSYGFIPRCSVWGVLTIGGQTAEVIGTGYYEHVWGNWTYGSPFQETSNTLKVLLAYRQLAGWWLSHRSSSMPASIGFSTDNNMFGYDWIWAAFDNGWSMFYGNIPFWVYDGPAFGILYLISEKGQYYVFSDISYTYGNLTYVPDHDIYFPTAITLRARTDERQLALTCRMACDVHTYLDTNLSSPYWEAIYLWESPGPISGCFNDGTTTVPLSGLCEIEPERQTPAVGHHHLSFQFYQPMKALGVSFNTASHRIGIGIGADLQLLPQPAVRIRIGR